MTRIDAGVEVASGLVADVHLPDRVPAPVVVTRTPYDRAALHQEGRGWARHGFVFVAQDVRGRYGSPGCWQPYRGERADGRELLEWVHDQPWCSGQVAVSGASYAAYTAWTAALAAPGLAAAVLSQVPAMGTERVAFDRAGILRLVEHAGWWGEHAEARTSRSAVTSAMLTADPALLAHLPVRDIGDRLWARVPGWWSAVAAGPSRPAPEAVTDAELAGCGLPALHVGGWYDLLVAETLHQWSVAGGALLVGPWEHALSIPGRHRVGARDHGPGSEVRIGERQVAWLRAVLAGATPSWTQVFRMGDNAWLDAWPPATTTSTWHAQPGGGLAETAGAAGALTFHHDPAQPYPSVLPGHDRRALDGRSDVATFRTEPLVRPLPIAGAAVVRLHATTSAADADWIVRLCERRSDGTVVELSHGVLDRPGTPLATTAITVAAGSCLELSVTGSDFPVLARNLGTGADRCTTTETVAGDVRVYTAATAVDLPIMECP